MRGKNIAIPGIGIAAQPYFHGSNLEKPAGYELWFILWDKSEKSADWFEQNRGEIVSHFDNLHIHEDYEAAFDLHNIDPRWQHFDEINFAQLANHGEVCVLHEVIIDEARTFHLLFVRRDATDYILNGGFVSIIDEDLPSVWSEVAEEDRGDFFEVRVPAEQFEVEYKSAVQQFYREKLQEKSHTPESRSWLKRLDGEFS